ncbi:MAG: protein phosphatase 2C domain-containing protein [Elainellaceae cyanobacterium]
MLQCPNYQCQASNAESSRFCQRCRTPLRKRYLWAVGLASQVAAQDPIAGRYRHQGSRIFLDLQPGTPPETLAEVPAAVLPYLHLADYRLHLPQVYGWVDHPSASEAVLLLSDPAIYRPSIYTADEAASGQSSSGEPQFGDAVKSDSTQSGSMQSGVADQADSSSGADFTAQSSNPILLPKLEDCWRSASTWRRLNWLWQLAQLWQPLQREQVASSLLSPDLIRTEGALVRLLELKRDPAADRNVSSPALFQLGQVWQSWVDSNDTDSRFFASLSQHLIDGKIEQPGQLIAVLEGAIAQLSQTRSQSLHLVTQTDQGPSRARNEDACFPPSGNKLTYSGDRLDGDTSEDEGTDPPVLIVCDGIGGHQGGDVASQLAIHAVCDHLIEQTSVGDPSETFRQMSDAIYDANDLISHRNDGEQRRNRQRMGTTLVMALVHDYACYISHVGDSRAYWITRWGCHQVTLDDDVASRAVRMGQATHPSALSQPSAGSLVQALGMADSMSLHPTVQRLLLDDSGLLLLCSDGLSDNDLVESIWQYALLPALAGEKDLSSASRELVTLANTQNGYDNVTVGLMRWEATAPVLSSAKVLTLNVPPPRCDFPSTRLQLGQGHRRSGPDESRKTTSPLAQSTLAGEALPSTADQPEPVTPIALKTDLRRSAGLMPLLAGIVILLGLGGFLIYAFVPSIGNRFHRSSSTEDAADSPSPIADATQGVADNVPLTVGTQLRVGGDAERVLRLQAYAAPSEIDRPINTASTDTEGLETREEPTEPVGHVMSGTLVEILGRSELSQSVQWIELRVCALPPLSAGSGALESGALESEEASSTPSPRVKALLQAGETAWFPEATLTAVGLQALAGEAIACPPAAN